VAAMIKIFNQEDSESGKQEKSGIRMLAFDSLAPAHSALRPSGRYRLILVANPLSRTAVVVAVL